MVPLQRFTVILDACTMYPMLARDVLLTLAAHEFFNPKWSTRIREEWMRNLAAHLHEHLHLEVIHPDDFVMDLITLNEKRAVAAFRELRARKKSPPWDAAELVRRLNDSGLVQTSLWVRQQDVSALIS